MLQDFYNIVSWVGNDNTDLSLKIFLKVKVLIAQLCQTLCDTMDHSLPGSSVHRISRQEYWSGLPFPSSFLHDTKYLFVVVQSLSHVWLFVIPWTVAHQASLSLTISRSLPKFLFIVSMMPSSHLILWCPLLLLPLIFPSIRDFSNELSVCIRWLKSWSFSFSISPFSECSGFISPKIDWFDLLAVQGNFGSLFQNHSSKALILWHSAFFTVQLSHIVSGKTIALTIWTFVSRVMSLLFNTVSRFVITFLQEAIVFWFHGCSHHPQLFWSPKRGNLSLLSPFPLLFAMQ